MPTIRLPQALPAAESGAEQPAAPSPEQPRASASAAPGRSDVTAPADAVGRPFAARAAILAYGLVAYASFLVTFLYAIGFVAGIGVPKGIDDGARIATSTAIAVNVALLSLFAIQHTIMARPAFKRRWTRLVPVAIERSTFVLATCAVLAAIFAFWRPLPDVVWSVGGSAAAWLWTVHIIGWLIVLAATFLIDHFDLFGLRQTVAAFRDRAYVPPRFQERWLYRLVRHPLMLGFLIAFWATPTMTAGHLLFAGVTTAYVLVALRIEEATLVELHGADYERYRGRVRGLLPLPRRARQ